MFCNSSTSITAIRKMNFLFQRVLKCLNIFDQSLCYYSACWIISADPSLLDYLYKSSPPLLRNEIRNAFFSPITIYEHHRYISVGLKEKQSYIWNHTQHPQLVSSCVICYAVAKAAMQKEGGGDSWYPLIIQSPFLL